MPTDNILVNSAALGSSVEIIGNRIHFVENPGKDTVILLPGVGFNIYHNRHIYNKLAEQGIGVIAIDLPGCGYSSLNQTQKFTPEHIADILDTFLEFKNIPSAHFFGVAEGGTYSMCFAELYPDRVKTLTLVSPGSMTNEYPFWYKQLITPAVGEIIMRTLKRERIEKYLKWLYFNKIIISNTTERQTYTPFENQATRLWMLYLLRDYSDRGVYAHLDLIQCETLIVWGEYDYAHPISMSNRLLNGISGSRLLKVNNVGHMVCEVKHMTIMETMLPMIKSHADDLEAENDDMDTMT